MRHNTMFCWRARLEIVRKLDYGKVHDEEMSIILFGSDVLGLLFFYRAGGACKHSNYQSTLFPPFASRYTEANATRRKE